MNTKIKLGYSLIFIISVLQSNAETFTSTVRIEPSVYGPKLILNDSNINHKVPLEFRANNIIKWELGQRPSGQNHDMVLWRFNGTSYIRSMTWLHQNGNVGIGTDNPAYKLAVNGTIRTKEIIVDTGWSDFVFEDGYELRSLEDVQSHIEKHGHLPDVPSAATVESEGLSVGEAQKIMMQKIEELTLYMIEKDKQIEVLQQRIAELETN